MYQDALNAGEGVGYFSDAYVSIMKKEEEQGKRIVSAGTGKGYWGTNHEGAYGMLTGTMKQYRLVCTANNEGMLSCGSVKYGANNKINDQGADNKEQLEYNSEKIQN
jgi:hypothetical protein